ncbi:MAG: zinc-binding dehydrogenase [Sphingomonadales bacterium]|jgi:alcohol dehydrogenase
MKAVLLMGHGDIDQIKVQTDFPKPIPDLNDVLVEVKATSLNYHDIFTRRGMPGIKIPLPIITGSDVAGVISALGPDARGCNIGDRVLINPLFNDNRKIGLLGEIANGGRAEFVIVRDYMIVPIEDNISFEDAAALPLAYGTAHRMMITIGKIKKGETVLVLGASGGVGVACVQLAKLKGANVIACASTVEKLIKLKEIGADHSINYKDTDFKKACNDISGKPRINGDGGVDIVVNFTGGETWMPSIKCVKKGGRILTCGATAGFNTELDLRFIWTFEHQILGSNGWEPEDLTALLDLISSGRLNPVIDSILPLEKAADAEKLMEDRNFIGKILLKP